MNGRPLIIDTNVLVMYAIGLAGVEFSACKATRSYDSKDFKAAHAYVEASRRIISLPNIWTEFSNLALGRHDRMDGAVGSVFLRLVERWSEEYVATKDLVGIDDGPAYQADFGLTDNAIARIAIRSDADVLTDDGRLCDWLGRNRIKAFNIRHARTPR